jgi:hypothetical protein
MVDNGSLGSFYHIIAPRRGIRGTVASVQNIYIYRKREAASKSGDERGDARCTRSKYGAFTEVHSFIQSTCAFMIPSNRKKGIR